MFRFLAWLLSSRLVIALWMLFCAAGVVITAVFIGYNALFSLDRLSAIFAFDNPFAGVAIPALLRPLMKDLSLVSPILVWFTFLRMFVAALRLLAAGDGDYAGPRFPFPNPYKAYFIQIGLLGTMVGFVIAFSHLEPGSRSQADTLLVALGTALWSTLTAIALAYVLGPLIELGFQWWLRRRTGKEFRPDPMTAIEQLRQRTVQANESLERFARSLNTLSMEMDTLELKNRLIRVEREQLKIATDIVNLGSTLQNQTRINLDAQQRLLTIESAIQQQDHKLESFRSRTSQAAAANEQIEARVDQIEQQLVKLLNQLRRVFD